MSKFSARAAMVWSTQRGTRAWIALKVLNDTLTADPRAHAAFDREATLAARLDHPNIVTVHDRSHPDDPKLWLAMRRIHGGDAAALLAKHPDGLAPQLVVDLIADAAAALDYAHGEGVLHRDVKPANLLIETDPRHGQRALLTDFGIARTVDSTVTLSAISASFAYAAPERFTRTPTDHRADIYSLGATLFHLLTGQPPFPRDDQAAVIGAHLNEPPPAPTQVRADLPAQLDAVVATALAKNPADRYPTCTALAEAARQALPTAQAKITHTAPPPAPGPTTSQSSDCTFARRLADTEARTPNSNAASGYARGTPVLERQPPPAYGRGTRGLERQPPEPSRRIGRRLLLTSVAIAAPVSAAAWAGISLIPRRSSTLEPVTVLTAHTDYVLEVAFSPDGTQLATAGADNVVRIWDALTHQQFGQPLTGHGYWVNSVVFSPDGTQIATGSRDSTARIWDARTHQQIGQTLTGHPNSVFSVTFSPDGTQIAGGGAEPMVRIWDARTHQQIGQTPTGQPECVFSLAFSPDGTQIATGGLDDDDTAQIWDARTHQLIGQLKGHTDSVFSVAFSPDGTRIATGSTDNTVRIWDGRTHDQKLTTLTGHTDWVVSVAFSPDCRQLATGSKDSTVRIWDLSTHRQVGGPYREHTGSVNSVAFSPDGSQLATGSNDRTARIWRVPGPT
ncbi:WD40 repeat domain-containing serine/threonine protein kinase [Nocardia fluminea]|uniref:WD40 repeat domain-containing serine/threonine protein kinase n=1 Tax=Nocardia fluminea TaxID=134984 RepID=UPI00364CE122